MKGGNRGEAVTIVLIVLGLLGVLFVTKPKWLSGDSKRAATSTKTTEAVVVASDKRGATAAASVVKIGEANATAPESPEKAFIAREVPVALSLLPPPDQTALIEAERRKVAVLSGKLEQITPLYDLALKKSDSLGKDLAKAIAAKRASDLALEQEAAERLGAERTRNWAILAVVLAGGLYLYVKFTHVSPGAMATIVSDLRNPVASQPAIAAVDAATTRLQQWMISTLAKLKTTL